MFKVSTSKKPNNIDLDEIPDSSPRGYWRIISRVDPVCLSAGTGPGRVGFYHSGEGRDSFQ